MPAKRDANLMRLILYLTIVLVLSTLLGASLSKTEIATWMVVALSTGAGLLGLLPLVRRLEQIGTVIDAVRRGESIDPIKRLRFDPLAGFVQNVNGLLRGDPDEALRQDLLEQVEHSAAQQERNRMARELHDSIKQQLFSIQMSAATAQVRLGENSDDAVKALEDVRKSSQEAMVEMNALLQQLSPQPLERVGLAQALREQCEALGYRSGATVTCEIGELPSNGVFPPGAQEGLFRIGQEALSNVARHARASQVRLRLSWNVDADQVELELHDDGQGFNLEGVEAGRGLANIRERIERLGGWMRLRSASGQGTDLQVGIPLRQGGAQPVEEELTVGPSSNRAVLTGLGMGVLAAAALSLAWLFNAPNRFEPGWARVNGLAAAVGYLIAMAVFFLAGWMTGRKAQFNAVLEGGASGLIAALTAYGLVGAAWAAMSGSNALLLNGPTFVPDEGEALRLLITAGVGIFYWTHGLFWGMLIGGMGLGAVGGMVASRGQTMRLPENWQMSLNTLLLPGIVSGALVSLVGAFLLPAMEVSMLNGLKRINGIDYPAYQSMIHTAIFICLFTAAFFYIGGLVVRYAILRQAIRHSSPGRLVDLSWDVFWMTTGSGAVAIAALYVGLQDLLGFVIASPLEANRNEFSIALVLGFGCLSLVISFLFTRLFIIVRDRLVQNLQPLPTFIEYAGLVGIPVSMILAFLLMIMGGNGWLSLGILVVEAVLLGYGLVIRRRRQQSQALARRSFREQFAWLSRNWAAYAWGFLIPALAMSASGAGVILLPAAMAQYLDIERLSDLLLSSLNTGMLIKNLFFYTGAAFIGLLIIALVQTGLTLLALSIPAMRARKGL